MSGPRSIPPAMLTDWIEHSPVDTGIGFFDGRRWQRRPYSEIAIGVRGAAEHLRRHGLGAGDRIALALPTGPAFVHYLFGAMALGAVPTPIAPPGHHGRGPYSPFLQARLQTLRPAALVAAGAVLPGVAPDLVLIDADGPLPIGAPSKPTPVRRDEIALIQFTSGSASAPKAVTLTRRAIEAQIGMIQAFGGRAGGDIVSGWLPLHHDMGLIGLLLVPVALGSELFLMRPEHFLRRPVDWLATFADQGAEHSAAPNFALEHLLRRTSAADLRGMDLSGWKTLFVGSDRVSFPTLQAVTRLLEPFGLPRRALTPSYGLAEATLMVCSPTQQQVASALTLRPGDLRTGAGVEVIAEHDLGGPPAVAAVAGPTVVSCGRPVAGARIDVLGDSGQVLPESQVGQLRITSPALSRGYLGAVPAEGFSAAGYLSGDLGFRYGGQIYVLGRMGDSVKVNGRFVVADDVGPALAGVLGLPVNNLVVVLQDLPDGPATLVAVQQEPPHIDEQALGDVLGALGLAAERAAVIRIPRAALPLTTSGKPQRQDLWQQVRHGPVRGRVLYRGTGFPSMPEAVPVSQRVPSIPERTS